jgi:hypothetical protein
MDILPTWATVKSFRTWLKIMLAPASTFQYMDEYFDPSAMARQKIYMPAAIFALLSLLRLLVYPFRKSDRRILSHQ